MKTVMFHSYKGGSGKTLFSMNIAHILAKDFDKRVLLIEADFSMPSFQVIYSDLKPDLFFNDFLNSTDVKFSDIIYPNTTNNLGIIFCEDRYNSRDKVHGNNQAWFYEKLLQIKQVLKEVDYDFIIFDTSPGFHLFTINILTLTNYIMVLLRPDSVSYRSLTYLLENIYGKSIDLAGEKQYTLNLVFNQIPRMDLFEPVIDKWKAEIKAKFEFVDSIHEFYYDPTTSYYSAIEQFILPEDVETRIQLRGFIEDQLL